VGDFSSSLTPTAARELWRAHEAEPRKELVSVHVHVPFCETICTYCDCATEALQGSSQLDRYLEAIEREVAFFEGVVRRPIDRLYVGGGTPNILDERQLEQLLGLIGRAHHFVPEAVRCLEGHPTLSTREKLDVAASAGINRVSFGVQSLDPRVLKKVNRGAQTPADIERAVRDAFDAGVREVNLDLIYGLEGEPVTSVMEAVTWTLALAPTTLCLQLLNDSHYAAPYQDAEHRGHVAREFQELVARVEGRVAAREPAYGCIRRPDTLVIHRRDMPRDPMETPEYYAARDATVMSTLGYGRHAQSTLFGRFIYQNQERNSRFDPGAPQYAGRARSPALEVLTHLVAEIEHDGRASLARLRARLGDDATRELDPVLEELARAGHLAREGSELQDVALGPEGVQWAAEQVAPEVPRPPTGLGSVAIIGPESTWRIRVEPAVAEGRYFAVVNGVGLFYMTDPDGKPEDAVVARIMNAAAKLAGSLLGSGCPETELAGRLAAILDERLPRAGLGLKAKLEAAQPKRHRLTIAAPR
jgi:hypothetical protein